MAWYSLVAIYFIIWWLTLFAILPWGVRNAHEAGETVEAGHAHGAPVKAHMLRKLVATTVVAGVIFGLGALLVGKGIVTLDKIPFFPEFHAV